MKPKRRSPLGCGHPDDWEGDPKKHLRVIKFRKISAFLIPALSVVVILLLFLAASYAVS